MFTERNQQTVVGSLPAIIRNDAGLYDGDLRYYLKILFNNAKNLNNPYHNFRHIAHFIWLCFDAINFYWSTQMIKTGRERRNLLIAGMFHDFDHTGVAGPDIINIDRAINAFYRYCHLYDKDYRIEIAQLISFSEYPHKISSEEIGILGQIMRDADLAQSLSSAWIQQVVFGLAAEKGKSPLAMLEMQESFNSNLNFATDWAKQKFPEKMIQAKVMEIRELIELLK